MSFTHDLFLDLPDEIKRLIVTQYLTGASLCTALRVCRGWYSYFKNNVWNDPTIGNAIRNALEDNWRTGVFDEKEEYWMLDNFCEIGAVSPNYIALT